MPVRNIDIQDVNQPPQTISMLDAIRLSSKSASGIAALNLPPRQNVLGDWMKEGDTGFIFAPRGLGKTWFSMLIATAVANGGNAGPWKANGARKVVYIDGEMALDGMLERMNGMKSGENLIILNHEILFHLGGKTMNLADRPTQEALREYLVEVGAKMVIVDNLSCLCAGMEENQADDWEQLLSWLLELRRRKIVVLIVHHAGRNGDMRGTSRREDAAFWILKLDYADESKCESARSAKFVSMFTKERNSGREQMQLEWCFKTDASGMVDVSYKSKCQLEELRSWIQMGLNSATAISEAMGISIGHVSKLAKKASRAGWLEVKKRKYVLVSRPSSEAGNEKQAETKPEENA